MAQDAFSPVVAGVTTPHDRSSEEYVFDAIEEARDTSRRHHRRHEPRPRSAQPAPKDAPATPAPVCHPDDGVRGTKLDVVV
ncbi:MAG: hypothetical protein AB7I50_17570 [Vicinamibacterales bacterium]